MDLDLARQGDEDVRVEGREAPDGFRVRAVFARAGFHAGDDAGLDGQIGDGVLDTGGIAGAEGGLQGVGQGLALAGRDVDGQRQPARQ